MFDEEFEEDDRRDVVDTILYAVVVASVVAGFAAVIVGTAVLVNWLL